MEWLTSPETWIALLTLTVLEIVLGHRQHHLHLDPGRQAARRRAAGAPVPWASRSPW